MGWPNMDPKGWEEVESVAVRTWVSHELERWHGPITTDDNPMVILFHWFQAEHGDIFQAMVKAVPAETLFDAEADYLERKGGSDELR